MKYIIKETYRNKYYVKDGSMISDYIGNSNVFDSREDARDVLNSSLYKAECFMDLYNYKTTKIYKDVYNDYIDYCNNINRKDRELTPGTFVGTLDSFGFTTDLVRNIMFDMLNEDGTKIIDNNILDHYIIMKLDT